MVAAMASPLAHAACTLATSTTDANMGRAMVQALPPAANAPGYRSMGSRNVTINGFCETSQTSIRLAFTGLQQLADKPLTRWGGTVGAIAFRIESTTVEGIPVTMRSLSDSAGVSTPSLNLMQDTTLELDLLRLPVDKRKSFSVQVSLSGLLPEHFAPRAETRLTSQFMVQLLGAQ